MKHVSSGEDELTLLSDDEILALVHTRSRRLQRQIRFRDWREVIASAVVALMIAPAVTRGPMLARLAALEILAGLVLVAFRLWRARRLTAKSGIDVALPVTSALHAELQQIDAQIGLLESVAWWYVIPLLGGSVLLVAAWHGRGGWLFTLGYTVFAALMSWGIIAMNQRAARQTLQPRREDIVRLLAQIQL
jgi:hypothetical protein